MNNVKEVFFGVLSAYGAKKFSSGLSFKEDLGMDSSIVNFIISDVDKKLNFPLSATGVYFRVTEINTIGDATRLFWEALRQSDNEQIDFTRCIKEGRSGIKFSYATQ